MKKHHFSAKRSAPGVRSRDSKSYHQTSSIESGRGRDDETLVYPFGPTEPAAVDLQDPLFGVGGEYSIVY